VSAACVACAHRHPAAAPARRPFTGPAGCAGCHACRADLAAADLPAVANAAHLVLLACIEDAAWEHAGDGVVDGIELARRFAAHAWPAVERVDLALVVGDCIGWGLLETRAGRTGDGVLLTPRGRRVLATVTWRPAAQDPCKPARRELSWPRPGPRHAQEIP
jgi:hypothetical protein